jgi:hypothetical protein
MRLLLTTTVMLAALLAIAATALAAPAAKAAPKKGDDLPPGTVGSGAITLKQIENEVQSFVADKYGIVVNFVLP